MKPHWIAGVILSLSLTAFSAETAPSVLSSFEGLSTAEKYATEALQGIVNRPGPRLLVAHSGPGGKNGYTYTWADIYRDRYGLRFETVKGFPALFAHFGDRVKGVAVYDPTIDGTRCIALTLAGTDDLLPVDAEMLANHAVLLGGLPVRYDLRGLFTNSLDVYEWALKEVMPRCNRRMAHTPAGPDVDGTHVGAGPYRGFDWTVAHRGFIFNLGLEYQDTASFDHVVQGNKAQSDLYRRILAALESPALFFGYGEFEMDWFTLLGQSGHYYLHWGDNLSFHEQVLAHITPIRQRPHAAAALDPHKYTVCFVTSEGDTMKGPLPFFSGSWFDPRRGEVPMNWAIHPLMARFPAMLENYYQTATSNDCFVAMQVYDLAMPNLSQFAPLLAEDLRQSDLSVICGSFGAPSRAANREAFCRGLHPLGVFEALFHKAPREGSQVVLPDGTPVVSSGSQLAYWHRLLGGWSAPWQEMARDTAQRPKVITALTDEIARIAAAHPPPFVVLVYSDLHGYDRHCSLHADVAAALDPHRFQTARLDDAFALLRKSGLVPDGKRK